MLQVKISMITKDGYGNENILNISSDDWGIIKYKLSGRKSKIPFSLSNLDIGWKYDCNLPTDIEKYTDVNRLMEDIKYCINSGVEDVIEILYSKQKELV
ncbi:MAG: hypothetical protein H8D94_00050 [Candidatus Pelagibacter sp.]|nr:hypothetical protein [Candidatus Pelagibacter sp.]